MILDEYLNLLKAGVKHVFPPTVFATEEGQVTTTLIEIVSAIVSFVIIISCIGASSLKTIFAETRESKRKVCKNIGRRCYSI